MRARCSRKSSCQAATHARQIHANARMGTHFSPRKMGVDLRAAVLVEIAKSAERQASDAAHGIQREPIPKYNGRCLGQRRMLLSMSAAKEGAAMENEFSRVLNALPGCLWTALPAGRVDLVNLRWCEYTVLSLDQLSGKEWQTVVHPEDLRNSSIAGEPSLVPASPEKWKRASMGSIAGSGSPAHGRRATEGARNRPSV